MIPVQPEDSLREQGPLPFLVAMLVADLAIREEKTKKVSLVGIFEGISASAFPAVHHSLAIYAKVTDAEGSYDFRLQLIHLDKAQLIAETADLKAQATSRLATGEILVTMLGIEFPEPGLYEFRLLANGRYVGSKTLRVDRTTASGG